MDTDMLNSARHNRAGAKARSVAIACGDYYQHVTARSSAVISGDSRVHGHARGHDDMKWTKHVHHRRYAFQRCTCMTYTVVLRTTVLCPSGYSQREQSVRFPLLPGEQRSR